jgi:NADH:ubiquinone oxidoreductase subunit 5 (subunit L)/multisubunit Na+/H+ antiporter MnhA subunit
MKLLRKNSCLPLLIVVLAMILTSPLLQEAWPGRLVLGIAWSVLFGLTGYIVFPTRRWLWIYVALITTVVALYTTDYMASEALGRAGSTSLPLLL